MTTPDKLISGPEKYLDISMVELKGNSAVFGKTIPPVYKIEILLARITS